MAFGFVGFWRRYNGSVSLSAYLGHVSHYWGCETTDALRTKRCALKIVMTVSKLCFSSCLHEEEKM